MSAASTLARGRTLAESLMVDACTITRRTTGQTTNRLTGVVTPATTAVYTGRCKAQTSGGGNFGDRNDVGEVAQIVLRMELHLPVVGSESVARGDLVSLTASVHDAGLLGRTWRVHDVMHKSFATARRLQLEEVT